MTLLDEQRRGDRRVDPARHGYYDAHILQAHGLWPKSLDQA
jgi:hypothetical protein